MFFIEDEPRAAAWTVTVKNSDTGFTVRTDRMASCGRRAQRRHVLPHGSACRRRCQKVGRPPRVPGC